MKYKEYPKEFWTNIKNTTKEIKEQGKPLVAAFDADGTLWDLDMGENLFHYTIEHKLVPLPENPWEEYLHMKKINNDPRAAYLWLAQIYKGIPLSQVKKWAEEALQSITPVPIFSEQKELISFFKSENVDVYIITASIKWAVEPGALLLGLEHDNVIGIETKVKDLIVTNELKGIISYKKGKPEALKLKTGFFPFFASGNTEGDLELLESATHLRLAVSAANRDDELYKSEFLLQETANKKSWMSHRFL